MNQNSNSINNSWFGNLLLEFKPSNVDIEGKDPESMKSAACKKAFTLTTIASLPPGPLGIISIIPELIGLTKLQVNLVYSIAEYYHKEHQVNATILLMVFGNEAGIKFGSEIAGKQGSKYIVKALTSETVKKIAEKIGVKITARAATKAVVKFIPFVTAPILGYFSSGMTKKIGEYAINFFSQYVEIMNEEAKIHTCSNGHSIEIGQTFCHECGEKLNHFEETHFYKYCSKGHQIPIQNKFCPECGEKSYSFHCSKGHEIAIYDKFCHECGEKNEQYESIDREYEEKLD